MIAGITDWILSLNGNLALAIVFAATVLEASAFIGFLFPGEIAVLLGGVLAFQGRVPLPAVIVAAVAGAIIGDSIGYYVGRRWGQHILREVGTRIPFLRRRVDEHLESAKAYLQRRGGAAVFLGRFTAALRVMVPGLAGMAEMPYGQFFAYNVAGGLIWGTSFVLLGYYAGAAWERVAADVSRVGLALLVVILAGLVLTKLSRSVRDEEHRLVDRLAGIRAVAWLRGRYPGTAAWLARRVDLSAPSGLLRTCIVIAGAICVWVFAGLAQDVVAHEEAVLTDPGVTQWFVAHREAWATSSMQAMTWLGSNASLIPLVVAVGAYFFLRDRTWRPGAYMAAALIGVTVLHRVAKDVFTRPRPPVPLHLISVSGYAFPSGHASAAVACWGMAAVVLGIGRGRRVKVALWCGAFAIAALVGLSRVYLGVHWWTDVVGGFALGGSWLSVLALGILSRRFAVRVPRTVRGDRLAASLAAEA
jgi:membrane protein DedA with SNARE-associated domain/membrane-associated phospholipid phosphatase